MDQKFFLELKKKKKSFGLISLLKKGGNLESFIYKALEFTRCKTSTAVLNLSQLDELIIV